MTKFASEKKNHTKIILTKRNLLKLNDLELLCYSKTQCSNLSRVIYAHLPIFASLKWEIDETGNF